MICILFFFLIYCSVGKNPYDEVLLTIYRFRACYDRPNDIYGLDKCFCLYQMNRALYGTIPLNSTSLKIKHDTLSLYNNETNNCNRLKYPYYQNLDNHFQINSDKMILLYKKTGLVYHITTYTERDNKLIETNDMFKVRCVDTLEESQQIYIRVNNKAIDFQINGGYTWLIQKDYCWIYNNNITPLIIKIDHYNLYNYVVSYGVSLLVGFLFICCSLGLCVLLGCLGLSLLGCGVSIIGNIYLVFYNIYKKKPSKPNRTKKPDIEVTEVKANPVDEYFEEPEEPEEPAEPADNLGSPPKIEVNQFEF